LSANTSQKLLTAEIAEKSRRSQREPEAASRPAAPMPVRTERGFSVFSAVKGFEV
jgi:hypothetical protein